MFEKTRFGSRREPRLALAGRVAGRARAGVPWTLLVLMVFGVFWALGSAAGGGSGAPFPPGSRVQGSRPDAILILFNTGAGAALRTNSGDTGPAVAAYSHRGDAIDARAAHKDRNAVLAHNTQGVAVTGRSESNVGVVGVTKAKGMSGVVGRSNAGVGVTGHSATGDGVVGWTESKAKSGVFGWSTNGIGVTAQSPSGTALLVDGTSKFKKFASFEGGHGDLAENYRGGEDLSAGDVVVIAAGEALTLELARRADDTALAGIVSTAPSMRLSGQIDDDEGVPLVIAGRTLCKVDAGFGPIRPGDLLTSSPTPGHAMKAQPLRVGEAEIYRPGTILGKALDPWSRGRGKIRVMVTLQ